MVAQTTLTYAVIEEAIGKLMDGSIGNYRYEPATAEIVPVA
jgi:hypothetical protein